MSIAKIDLTYTDSQDDLFFPKEQNPRFTIVPKGRRWGATKGSANAVIEWATEGISPILWVDTINGNIDRYYERYFLPELKKSNIKFGFNYNKKQLSILDSVIDFRSADSPESIEGFGYKKIILNEAGIILKDDYLYTNSILPMLIDYPDSQLYAIGTPKGKYKKDGTEHMFYKLSKKDGTEYRQLRYSSYDNPILSADEIKLLENEIALLDPNMVRQEIYGEFIEMNATNPFASQYKADKHESLYAVYQAQRPMIISIDFNLNPFAINFAHKWLDSEGEHFHIFDEMTITNGSIPKLIDQIKEQYSYSLPLCKITGDSMGSRKSIEQKDNSSYYIQILRGLRLRESQLVIAGNPTHENSRADTNYVLYHHPDFKMNPKSCPNTCRDMKIVQIDNYGKIMKSNRAKISQQSDHLDNVRYMINSFLKEWKDRDMRKINLKQ